MVTIPLPIPTPIIKVDGDKATIDYTRTELAKRARELGKVLTFDEEKSLPLCSACKEPKAHYGVYEPPAGYRWGGWFCSGCIHQGSLAKSLNLVIDQLICRVENVIVFDKNGMAKNGQNENLLDIRL